MNKSDLVNYVASQSKLSKADSARAVDAIMESITKCLKQGKDLRLTGFGTFSVIKRKARQGRNPRTGEAIQIKASKLPKFRAGKALKASVAA